MKTRLQFFIKFTTQDLALDAEIQAPFFGFIDPNSAQLWEGASLEVWAG